MYGHDVWMSNRYKIWVELGLYVRINDISRYSLYQCLLRLQLLESFVVWDYFCQHRYRFKTSNVGSCQGDLSVSQWIFSYNSADHLDEAVAHPKGFQRESLLCAEWIIQFLFFFRYLEEQTRTVSKTQICIKEFSCKLKTRYDISILLIDYRYINARSKCKVGELNQQISSARFPVPISCLNLQKICLEEEWCHW